MGFSSPWSDLSCWRKKQWGEHLNKQRRCNMYSCTLTQKHIQSRRRPKHNENSSRPNSDKNSTFIKKIQHKSAIPPPPSCSLKYATSASQDQRSYKYFVSPPAAAFSDVSPTRVSTGWRDACSRTISCSRTIAPRDRQQTWLIVRLTSELLRSSAASHCEWVQFIQLIWVEGEDESKDASEHLLLITRVVLALFFFSVFF